MAAAARIILFQHICQQRLTLSRWGLGGLVALRLLRHQALAVLPVALEILPSVLAAVLVVGGPVPQVIRQLATRVVVVVVLALQVPRFQVEQVSAGRAMRAGPTTPLLRNTTQAAEAVPALSVRVPHLVRPGMVGVGHRTASPALPLSTALVVVAGHAAALPGLVVLMQEMARITPQLPVTGLPTVALAVVVGVMRLRILALAVMAVPAS